MKAAGQKKTAGKAKNKDMIKINAQEGQALTSSLSGLPLQLLQQLLLLQLLRPHCYDTVQQVVLQPLPPRCSIVVQQPPLQLCCLDIVQQMVLQPFHSRCCGILCSNCCCSSLIFVRDCYTG